MTIETFTSLLQSTGIPFTFHRFKTAQKLPFGAWGVNGEPDFKADNIHFVNCTSLYVEYYFEDKNLADESKIKNVFINNDIPYSFEYETYIESENMYVIRYSVNFIGG